MYRRDVLTTSWQPVHPRRIVAAWSPHVHHGQTLGRAWEARANQVCFGGLFTSGQVNIQRDAYSEIADVSAHTSFSFVMWI